MAAGKARARAEKAVITIKGPGRMTKRGRRDIARWLREHAAWLLRHGDEYTDGVFRGRFIYMA